MRFFLYRFVSECAQFEKNGLFEISRINVRLSEISKFVKYLLIQSLELATKLFSTHERVLSNLIIFFLLFEFFKTGFGT